MRRFLVLSFLAILGASIFGGRDVFGRLFLILGMPKIAAATLIDPNRRGVAYYRAGNFAAAALNFKDARNFYNLGNAEVMQENYAAALEAYDLAITQAVPKARENFDIVASYYAGLSIDPSVLALFTKRTEGPMVAAEIGQGDGRAAGSGDGVNNANTMLGLAQVESHGNQTVRRVFDDLYMVADERWLGQLSDVPGEFLKARILEEHKRRVRLGLSPQTVEANP